MSAEERSIAVEGIQQGVPLGDAPDADVDESDRIYGDAYQWKLHDGQTQYNVPIDVLVCVPL
jgi:hypothetical protein